MKEKQIDINELIKIEQLPKIFSQLEIIGKEIDKRLVGIDKLECNEENKQEVKRRRTEINNMNTLMENKRKEIKNQILQDYNIFNDKYELEIKNKLVNASNILKDKIDEIEIIQKKNKEDELRNFASEYFESNHIENIVKFEDINLNITLSSSEKSLKEQIVNFCNKVSNDLKLIELEEYKDEILLEYKNNLDFTESKLVVFNRHKQLEELQKQQNKVNEIVELEEKNEEEIDELITPPKEILEDSQKITTTFTLTGTVEQIKQIKNLIIELGVEIK